MLISVLSTVLAASVAISPAAAVPCQDGKSNTTLTKPGGIQNPQVPPHPLPGSKGSEAEQKPGTEAGKPTPASAGLDSKPRKCQKGKKKQADAQNDINEAKPGQSLEGSKLKDQSPPPPEKETLPETNGPRSTEKEAADFGTKSAVKGKKCPKPTTLSTAKKPCINKNALPNSGKPAPGGNATSPVGGPRPPTPGTGGDTSVKNAPPPSGEPHNEPKEPSNPPAPKGGEPPKKPIADLVGGDAGLKDPSGGVEPLSGGTLPKPGSGKPTKNRKPNALDDTSPGGDKSGATKPGGIKPGGGGSGSSQYGKPGDEVQALKSGQTVSVTPHVQWSSSVGVVGCMINRDYTAFWPGSPGCNDICIKLTHKGKSVHLLRIDSSGSAHDISTKAWLELTGMESGGIADMTVDWADMSECLPLLQDTGGKMPLLRNSLNWATGCTGEKQGQNWLAQNYQAINMADQRCVSGTKEVCDVDAVTWAATCPLGQQGLETTGPGIKDIGLPGLPALPGA